MQWTFRLRSLERLVVVLGGVLSLCLGYLLLIKGLSGEARLIVEFDKTKVQLTNALPGIFFALFGSAILIVALRQNVTASLQEGRNPSSDPPPFPGLPGALAEAQAVQVALGATNPLNLEAKDVDNIMRGLRSGEYRILHLAAHGVCEPDAQHGAPGDAPQAARP